MDNQTLYRYISGRSSEKERRYVTEWIQESDEHKHEFFKAHKIYDVTLWNTSQEMKTKKASLSFMGYVLRIAAVAAVLLCIAGIWRLATTPKPVVSSMMSIYAPAGQRTEIVLPDSTKVWLNSGSKLTFANRFEGETRNVTLDGEGYFEVKKDISRPFIVETNRLGIRVLGTEFNVIAYEKENTWETSLIKGSIELFENANRSIARIEPNTTVMLIDNKIVKKPIENKEYFLWTKGLICFNNKTIKEILRKLSLYYDYNITIRDSKYLDRQYTGKFWAHDGIEHVLKVLQLDSKFKFTIKEETKNVIIN